MTILQVAANDSFQIWLSRTNQVISVIDQLTDGTLFVNGSIIFANSLFSLSLPSMNVANNLVLTGTGNTVFLRSSNIAANGTLFSTGSGLGLSIANNAFIGKNLTVDVTTANTINANTISSNFVFDAGKRVITSLVVNTSGGILGSTIINGPAGTLNISQTLVDNFLSTSTTSIPTSNALNAVFNAIHNVGFPGTGGPINSSTGGWSSFNIGKQLLLTCPSVTNVPGIGFTDSQGANFWAIYDNGTGLAFASMPDINNSTSPPHVIMQLSNTGMVLTGTTTNTIDVSNLVTSVNAIISNTLTTNTINASGEIIGAASDLNQFRAVQGNFATIFRNDASGNFNLLTTGSVANPFTASFNALRPFSFNQNAGGVTIDATGVGTVIGGPITFIGNGLVINSGSAGQIVLPNSRYLYGRDTLGNPRILIGTDADSQTGVFQGIGGLTRFYDVAGSTVLAYLTATGDFIATGGLQSTGNMFFLSNNRFLVGKGTGGTFHSIIGLDSSNIITLNCGPSYWRIVNNNLVTEIVKVDNVGNLSITGAFSVGIAPVNQGPGVIQANAGYLCKAGIGGGFRFNVFNWDFNQGTGANLYIDNAFWGTLNFGFAISDSRFKQNIQTASNDGAVETIRKLREVVFQFKDTDIVKDGGFQHLGYLAEELQDAIPEAVNGEPFEVDDDGKPIYQSVNHLAIIAKATQAISELADRYDALESRIKSLEKRMDIWELEV